MKLTTLRITSIMIASMALLAGGKGQVAEAADPPAKVLAGKVALVTGSARNLGRGYAVALAQDGASVMIHYHDDADRPDALETARLVRATGARAAVAGGDLCNVAVIRRMFDQTIAEWGRIDIVVNNAGKIVKKPIAEISESEFDSVFCVNARAPFFVMQEAARRLAENGRVINVGTSLIASVTPGYAIYAGSKSSLEQFTRALAREVGARGITVNMIAPGPVDTPFYRIPESPDAVAYATNLSVARRLGAVSDIVPLVRFLASPESQWITAQTLFINGGYGTR